VQLLEDVRGPLVKLLDQLRGPLVVTVAALGGVLIVVIVWGIIGGAKKVVQPVLDRIPEPDDPDLEPVPIPSFAAPGT